MILEPHADVDTDALQLFRGRTSRDALDAVRNALGGDAVIVRTRTVSGPRGSEIEILARGSAPAPHAPAAAKPQRSGHAFLAPPTDSAPQLDGSAVGRGALAVRGAPAPWQRVADKKMRVLALVGPTGVGKTTTLAKIAARALIEERLKVALITVDTYRIGAVDQMRRYGEIMSIPTYVARDLAGMQNALARAAQMDLVLIDTAGRSPLEHERLSATTSMLSSVPDIEVLLAVTASTPARQLGRIKSEIAAYAPSSLVITKLDEADGPASLLQPAEILQRPICCFTDGQRVPEDIHVVTPSMLESIQ